MGEQKLFLTYNQQMKRLRNNKHIICEGSSHKKILVRAGYFNIVNGYKTPFVTDRDALGNHIYLPGTTISQLQSVKLFDDELRSLLLKYITQIEEELRTLTGYKFDECNNRGMIPWFNPDAFDGKRPLQKKMEIISKAYNELGRSQLDYVKFYLENHEQIPTWIMIKAVNFSTFIEILQNSKKDVSRAICSLFGLEDEEGHPNVKLLIGSLHWMRKIRNACAHNERIYCISYRNSQQNNSGRIIEKYFRQLRSSYSTSNSDQRIFDLFIFFKYYLPKTEYKVFMKKIMDLLLDLQSQIHENAFANIRGHMGIKRVEDLNTLIALPKDEIDYNSFDH